jgi:hypothetical protein
MRLIARSETQIDITTKRLCLVLKQSFDDVEMFTATKDYSG